MTRSGQSNHDFDSYEDKKVSAQRSINGREPQARNVSRRSFLGTTLAGGAALYAGGLDSLTNSESLEAPDSVNFLEKTIPELQELMNSGALSSLRLTLGYLGRIHDMNPQLRAVIQTNPLAIAIVLQRDFERRHGHIRGPLHGIPVIVKDNIATRDLMQTTAGSLALFGSRVSADATVVHRMRAAGAVILGKANLSEWANFRGFAPFNGWSARGRFTRDPYLLDFDPCGSSFGSGVAAAANFCSTTVGTETDGSVVCPSGNNLCVGLKPTIGLVSQDGIGRCHRNHRMPEFAMRRCVRCQAKDGYRITSGRGNR